MPNYDAIIIGTGQSGPALARRLVAAGRKVAIMERKLFGGTCVNTGCTPTKTLAASAYVAHVARRAADYGVMIGGTVNVDMKAVKARKDAVVAVFRNGVEQSLKTLQGCAVYEGHGRFVARRQIAAKLCAGPKSSRRQTWRARSRLPTLFPSGDAVEAGGLLSYGPSLIAIYRRTAQLVGGTPAHGGNIGRLEA